MKHSAFSLFLFMLFFCVGCQGPENDESDQVPPQEEEAQILVRNQEFETAKPRLLNLLKENPKSADTLRLTALCLGGWLEPAHGSFIEIPGTGDYAPDPYGQSTGRITRDTAQGIWSYLLKGIEDQGRKYSDDWWEAKFHTVYARYRAGEAYPAYYEMATKLINKQKMFQEEMGGPEWKARFEYLDKAIIEKRNALSLFDTGSDHVADTK